MGENIDKSNNQLSCEVKISLPEHIQQFNVFDLYVDEHNLLMAFDCFVLRHTIKEKIDTKDLKHLELEINTKSRELSYNIPCLPNEKPQENIKNANENADNFNQIFTINYLKLQRITSSCSLKVDGSVVELENKFGFGFAARLHTDFSSSYVKTILHSITKVSNPSAASPIQRRIQREIDENAAFCRDQYKLNFVEFQVPDGHENPTKYTFNYNDTKLTPEQEQILQEVNSEERKTLGHRESIIEVGLIDILLSICYDIRTTENEPTCGSAWTRTTLSASLSYFEPIDNLRTSIISFLRRSLIYPLYRNYDLSIICVEDVIEALQRGSKWILKQFIATNGVFDTNFDSRRMLNQIFINDYIRYLNDGVTDDQLKTLSHNLKNISLSVTKKDLGLGLNEIEAELLQELIDDLHISDSTHDDEDEDSSEED